MEQKVNWHDFWSREGNPGFHQAGVNTYLEQFISLFDLAPGDTVFLPLCGKSVDMLWLAQQGFKVIGVELSEVAIKAFFKESALHYEIESIPGFTRYDSANISLYHGNFIDLKAQHLSSCKLVYDRASIVAIEPSNRPVYSQHMLNLIPGETSMLLVLLEYDQSVISGPPFSVPVAEVESYYSDLYDIQTLLSQELIEKEPRWREKGLESFRETVLKLEVRKNRDR